MKLIETLSESRAAKKAELDALLEAPEAEARDLTEDENAKFEEIRGELKALDERLEELRKVDAEERAASAAAAEYDTRGGRKVTVRSEPVTYDRRNQGTSYFHDLANAEINGNPEARRRLIRHGEEVRERADQEARANPGSIDGEDIGVERRDLNRTDGTGGYFVPPLWMMDEYVRLARGGRVIADQCNVRDLPPGTDSINLPKVSTGTAVAAQTADNASVQETDAADTVVTLPVRTIAGQQDVALQVLDQSPIAFDEVIFQDLAGDLAAKTDVQVISGSGSSGQVVGLRSITSVDTTAYTDGSPTVPELYPKIADTINEVVSNRYMPVEALFLHPRRWYWMAAALDSSNRPLVVPTAQGPYMALGALEANEAQGPVGHILGVPVWLDPNIPTTVGGGTEDVIIATRPSDHWLFESAVRTRVLPEVGSGTLTVRLQLYRYIAFTAERYPRSTSIVSGTGLAAPSF